MMADPERGIPSEMLTEVRGQLATLLERSKNTNRRLDIIESKLDAITGLEQRITKVETKVNVGSMILGSLSVIGNAIAAALGMRQ